MVALKQTNQKIYDSNIVKNKQSIIMVGQYLDARLFDGLNRKAWWNEKTGTTPSIHFSKYQIKESDMRIKTATFTSPQYFDLTKGLFFVLITSPYHEDFAGVILKVKENEDTKEYDYQCQDFSRLYQSKWRNYFVGDIKVYQSIRDVLTNGGVPLKKATSAQLNAWKYPLSGLRPAHWYDQSLWGSVIKFNPMTEQNRILATDISAIEYIRTLMFGTGAYVDVYFDKYGVCQIEPYHKQDWLTTGLHLYSHELASRTPEFDTTNVITEVQVENTDKRYPSKLYNSKNWLNLDLSAFFGRIGGYAQNPNQATTTTTSTPATKTSTTTTKKDNPYGTKKKAVWINADGGSNTIKNQLANALKKNGWSVHVSGTGPGWHYRDYFNCSSGYVLMMVMNGFCAGSMREAYSSKIQNVLKKKGVVLVPVWHTSSWTNPRGMAPYKYGDFSGYNASRAWDDNFSSSNPSIRNVGQWLKSVNAKYCCHPSLSGLMSQFLAGGYFAQKGGK